MFNENPIVHVEDIRMLHSLMNTLGELDQYSTSKINVPLDVIGGINQYIENAGESNVDTLKAMYNILNGGFLDRSRIYGGEEYRREMQRTVVATLYTKIKTIQDMSDRDSGYNYEKADEILSEIIARQVKKTYDNPDEIDLHVWDSDVRAAIEDA